MASRWRMMAAPIVRRVLEETRGHPEAAIRRALAEAYPFGERRMWPYKAWLAEVRHQRGFPRRVPDAAPAPDPSLFGESEP